MTLGEVAADLRSRLVGIFLPDGAGVRPFEGSGSTLGDQPLWKDLLLFHEYFDGDNGKGLGASHQTGWTGLVAELIDRS